MRRTVFVTILAVLLAGCGSSGPTPDPNLTPAPAPAGWTLLSWTDPGLSLAVPATWTSADPKGTNPPDPSLTPDQQLNNDFFNDMASGGHTRLAANGDVATPLASVPSGAVYVFIESGDASLQAFGDREDQLQHKLIPGVTIDRTTVVIPAGVAIRMAYAGTIVGWPPFYEVDYLLRLPDGRSMTVAISGTDKAANADTVSAFAARVIWTLKPGP